MKVSYSWLQEYFKEPIPTPEKLADLFTFHSSEVEDIEKIGNDTVLDIKILPDRAHYALSHRGIAREISFITGMKLDERRIAVPELELHQSQILELDIQSEACLRDSKLVIKNVVNKKSPTWLTEKLEALGQRSINFIVDVTNYAMLDMGQPLHAFDLDKLAHKNGTVKIVLKPAREGEKITILGGKEYRLPEGVLIFADAYNHDKPLDIAGIKGGAAAEIDEQTKNIIVLAANFEPAYIRRTSTKIGIRTDASKRSENGIPKKLTLDGLLKVADLILKESPEAHIEGLVDYNSLPEETLAHVESSASEISELLGIQLDQKIIEKIVEQLDLEFRKEGDGFIVTAPYYRKDIQSVPDLVEEIGRIYGYDKVPATMLPKLASPTPINKVSYWSEKIKDILVQKGYSEVSTYALTKTGDIEIQNPLASDKNFLRTNLRDNLETALTFNARNAPLLNLEDIKIFEIGNVFTQAQGEYMSFALSFTTTKSIKNKEKKIFEYVEAQVKELGELLGVTLTGLIESTEAGSIFEMNLTNLIEALPEPKVWDINTPHTTSVFKPISLYPFITRDIAVFVPEGISQDVALEIITQESGNLLVNHALFDVFHKEFPDGTKKTSYAFRLVFQSFERTLTDEEINPIMQRITDTMNSKEGWQVR